MGAAWSGRGRDAGAAAEPACFVRGTLLLTPNGELPVEAVVPGMVLSTLGGGRRRVSWVGRRSVDLRRHPDPVGAAPIRFRRGALGNGMPSRDLLVSPDHALFVNHVLIAARALVNGATVVSDPGWASVEYHHVALDAHDVVLANGAPAESFPDRGLRTAFAGGRVIVLHPDFADTPAAPWDCARRAVAGPPVQEARRILLTRARVLGHALCFQSDLHLLADGVRVAAAPGSFRVHGFAIPPGARDLRIVSRAGVPAEIDPASDDRRRLGVQVSRLVLRGPHRTVEFDTSDPALTDGFHAPERGAGAVWRWTDGHARLPTLPPWVTAIDVHVLAAQPAWARAALPDAPSVPTRRLS